MASTTFESSQCPQRIEPLLLKPTTLPHCPTVDTFGAGERIDSKTKYSLPTPTPSTVEVVHSTSQTTRLLPDNTNNGTSWSTIFLISLRIAFYILVLTMTVGLTLAACKFTNIWDPCETLYVIRTDCSVTSYFKGMIYHTDCTEEHKCILPGFERIIQHTGWSLDKHNETANTGSVFNE